MFRKIAPACALLLFLGVAAPQALASDPDGFLRAGDKIEGAVDEIGDVDLYRFDAIAGDTFTIKGVPGKKSPVILSLSVTKTGDDASLVKGTADPKVVQLVFTVLETGSYDLEVWGDGDSTGAYRITSKAKPAKGPASPSSEPGSGAPGSLAVPFDALAGGTISGTIGPAKGSQAVPGVPTLSGAAEFDPSPWVTLKGSKLALKKLPLPAFGSYLLEVDNVGDLGELQAKLKVARPKAKAKTIIESDFVIVPDASIPLTGTTHLPKLKLSGTLIDLSGKGLPKTLEWQRRGYGYAYGSGYGYAGANSAGGTIKVKNGAWKGSVKLLPGENEIRISGNGHPDGLVLRLTCNPGYAFGGQLVIDPDVVYVNEGETGTARVALTDASTSKESVALVVLDGDVETFVTWLTDDGNLSNGDEIEGDGIFTGRPYLLHHEAGLVSYRVVVGLQKGGEARSERFELLVSEHLSDGELTHILGMQGEMQSVIEQALANGTLDVTLDGLLADLLADPAVAEAGKNESGNGLWVVYESGIAGVLQSVPAGEKGGPSAAAPVAPVVPAAATTVTAGRQEAAAPAPDPWRAALAAERGLVQSTALGGQAPPEPYDAWYRPAAAEAVLPPGVLAATAPNRVESSKVRAIAAQYWDWGEGDDVPKMAKTLQDHGCFDVTYTKSLAKGAGSVEDFKHLGSYGIVLVSTHGDSFYSGLLNLWKEKFGWNGPFGQVVVHTNMAATLANKLTYEDDLKKGRLVLWYGSYGLTPRFITRYSGSMPNSLVYMSICRGAWNGTLASAFLGRGAGTFLGYSDYVAVSFCESIGPPLLDKLLEPDKTMTDAFIPGLKETDKDPAEFRLFGAGDLALDPGRLEDGDFEAANLAQAWSTAGDARVIPVLGQFDPTQGSWMGIISTGLGFTVSSGSMAQNLCLSAGAKSVSFRWNFISEEFIEYCGSIYQDYFTVMMSDTEDAGNYAILFSTHVDALCGDVFAVDFSFDQGDAYATGWRSATLPIPESLKGRHVSLSFAASDVGDSIYDTAILLDEIKVVE